MTEVNEEREGAAATYPLDGSRRRIIDLKLGFGCNNSCFFCAPGDKRKIYPDWTFDQLKETLIREKNGTSELVVSGGEPTIHPGFLRIVQCAAELGYEPITVQTNGRRFAYMDFCKLTVQAGARLFAISLHGHRPDMHDHLTRHPGAFAETVQGIRNLKNLGKTVATNTVITRPNYRHLPQMARLLCALGVDQIQFAFPHIIGNSKRHLLSTVPRKVLVKPYLLDALEIVVRNGRVPRTEAFPDCLLGPFRSSALEKQSAWRVIPDEGGESRTQEFTSHRKNFMKAHGPPCESCGAKAECEGPWKEYPEIFGWEEFRPL